MEHNVGVTQALRPNDDGLKTLPEIQAELLVLQAKGQNNVVITDNQTIAILNAILDQRAYQDRQYGPAPQRSMREEQWIKLITDYANNIDLAHAPSKDRDFRSRMVKVATLAIAALENVGFPDAETPKVTDKVSSSPPS